VRRFSLLCRFPREEHMFSQQKVIGHGFFLGASTRPFRSPYCSGATLRVCLCDALFFFMSPRPAGSTLPSRLHSTSLWSVFRPSLEVRWLRLTLFRSRILLAVMAPCLHFKPLDLLSRDLMFVFICAQEDFLLWIPMHPTRLHHRHIFSPLRRDFISASSPTCQSGACETWVPMGPHGPGS
jgi:hypothetical protein